LEYSVSPARKSRPRPRYGCFCSGMSCCFRSNWDTNRLACLFSRLMHARSHLPWPRPTLLPQLLINMLIAGSRCYLYPCLPPPRRSPRVVHRKCAAVASHRYLLLAIVFYIVSTPYCPNGHSTEDLRGFWTSGRTHQGPTMRYENWDVLLFPAGSKVPLQEFKTQCFATRDLGRWSRLFRSHPILNIEY
jgi:hypothetical protein